MCTPINCSKRGRPFGQGGCQVPVGNGICGEKRTLQYFDEFQKLFARKMEEIDANGGGDCVQVILFFNSQKLKCIMTGWGIGFSIGNYELYILAGNLKCEKSKVK